MRKLLILIVFIPVFAFAEAMYSPTWGFYIDLPEGYEYTDGDGRDRFSFTGPADLMFDLVIYNGRYSSMEELVNDVNRRLSNRGFADFFQYRNKQAAIMKMIFGDYDGWALAVELGPDSTGQRPILFALAYGPPDIGDLELFHLSALDSIAPTHEERRYPGPIMEYSVPRGERRNVPLAARGLSAIIRENDAEAAQELIEREFLIYKAYWNTEFAQQAATRYYRFIFRDSYNRIEDALSNIVYSFGGHAAFTDEQQRAFAQRILSFVQGFHYERDMSGSDFINLVTAVTQGRGDCDSRAMLFALSLASINIRSGIMISFHFNHAMGLGNIAGAGARLESHGIQWLVAEPVENINIGLIDQEFANPQHWFAILFE